MDVFLQDSSSTTGAGLSGLVFNTANLKAYYRKGATGTLTSISLVTQTVGGAWSSGGFVEIDATNAKGLYRFDIPDTILASSPAAIVHFYGATNLAQNFSELEIVAYDPFNATSLGLSRLDGTVTSRMATYTQPTGFLAATFPSGTVANTTNITAGTITTVTNLTNAPTNGDFTATMKTSAQTAADAAITANALVLEIEADTDTLTGFITAAPPTSATIATAVWAVVIDGTNSALQLMRGLAAAMLGKASGLATTTAKYRNAPDSKDVITATVDADGNRSAVTLDLT